jgi:hypothetical protein
MDSDVNSTVFSDAPPPVEFSFKSDCWSPGIVTGVFDAVMAALPLDSLVTLASPDRLSLSPFFDKQVWLHHAQRWPLLQHVSLAPSAASGFREMLLEDNGGRESPLLPSLTKIDLVDASLSARRTFSLCDALMKRVEQGVPLETLDLRTCISTSRAVELLSEIVVDVRGPDETLEAKAQMVSMWNSAARGHFVEDYSSGLEDDDDEDNLDEGEYGDGEYGEVDYDEDGADPYDELDNWDGEWVGLGPEEYGVGYW